MNMGYFSMFWYHLLFLSLMFPNLFLFKRIYVFLSEKKIYREKKREQERDLPASIH